MKTIGIIADEEERLTKYKWYEFWKKNKFDYFYLDDLNLEFVVGYTSQRKVEKKLMAENVQTVIFTKNAVPFKLSNIYCSDGYSLFRRLLPVVVAKVIKLKGANIKNATLAIIDDELSGEAASTIQKLYLMVRHITLITKNTDKAKLLAEKFLDDYGLAIEISDGESAVQCDVAIRLSGISPIFPKHTILIDVNSGNDSVNKGKIINWIGVNINYKIPLKVDSLKISETIELVCGIQPEYKINAFMRDERILNSADLFSC